jgi:hypothetical protein
MRRSHLNQAIMRRFGVVLVGDIHERACAAGWWLPVDAKRRRRLWLIRRARTLFIHIPKNAGMSVSHALYGEQIKHASIRYYDSVARRMLWNTTSFAVLRDPVRRFLSAFNYAQNGGSAHNGIAAPFRDRYMAFRSVDDALDHIEAAPDIYQIDHIFRPQSWYITDRAGKVSVDRLFLLEDFDRLRRFLALREVAEVPHLNHIEKPVAELTEAQIMRIRSFYARDFELVQALREEAAQRPPSLRELPPLAAPSGQRLAG